MSGPQELSLTEIRKYMLENNCKVTNHALVKHFKRFLTHHETQNEARKQFKTYVNILATIKTENNQKYLILRKKYINECPTDEVVQRAALVAASGHHSGSVPSSPGDASIISEGSLSSPAPFRQPPPYKPPPEVLKPTTGITVNQENSLNYRDCVKEFAASVQRIDPRRLARQTSSADESGPTPTPTAMPKDDVQLATTTTTTTTTSIPPTKCENKENLPTLPNATSSNVTEATASNASDGLTLEGASSSGDVVAAVAAAPADGSDELADNPMSVKEATRKFNRMASVEESKIISPPSKKKPEKHLVEEKVLPEVSLSHPKAKEWIVSMSRASYQELAKLASESPELVKLQDPATGYTALHWAAKHGDEDVVKLIAGTYKANVNATSNGGYTPLHLAMQFGRVNIFELLCNVYKANRDAMDFSGKKPLEYRMQRTSVSASTYSKIQAMRKQLLNSGYGTWRNQSQTKTYRKRFGIPADWLFECSSEEDNRSVQQLLGSGQWQWQWAQPVGRANGERQRVGGHTPAALSPSPSSASSSSRWYDEDTSSCGTTSPPSSDDDETQRIDERDQSASVTCQRPDQRPQI